MKTFLKFLLQFPRRVDCGIFWLRTSYWAGSIAGMVIALRTVLASASPLPGKMDFAAGPFAAGPFLFGWVFLLIWADRKPRERKAVLLLTFCPLLAGWAAAEIAAALSTGISLVDRLPFWLLQGFLFFLFIFSYLQSRHPHPKWWSHRV